MSKTAWIWIVVIIVILVIGFMVWGDKGLPGTEGGSSALRVGDNAVSVTDQKPGDEATVSLAVLGAPGYVVVHEKVGEEAGGTLGSSTLLPKGESQGVKVPLAIPLEIGKTYIAMLHLDNGDGVFDAGSDAPAMWEEQPIMMEFGVSADAETNVEVTI